MKYAIGLMKWRAPPASFFEFLDLNQEIRFLMLLARLACEAEIAYTIGQACMISYMPDRRGWLMRVNGPTSLTASTETMEHPMPNNSHGQSQCTPPTRAGQMNDFRQSVEFEDALALCAREQAEMRAHILYGRESEENDGDETEDTDYGQSHAG